jgi:hypothetical protein
MHDSTPALGDICQCRNGQHDERGSEYAHYSQVYPTQHGSRVHMALYSPGVDSLLADIYDSMRPAGALAARPYHANVCNACFTR